MSRPVVSVVMSVYNGEKYLKDSLESILGQSYKNFEFIIINDGSTDDTLKIIKSYKDPRIVLLDRANRGLVSSLNEGIREARGRYVARQDDDDISLPNRIRNQVALIQKSNAVLVSSAFAMFDEDPQDWLDVQCMVNNDLILKRELWVKNPFGHGATMFNREAAIKVGLYEEIGPAEDYDLWIKLVGQGLFAYLTEVGYLWRINPSGITQTKASEQAECAKLIRTSRLKGNPPSIPNKQFTEALGDLANCDERLSRSFYLRLAEDQRALLKRALRSLDFHTALREYSLFRLVQKKVLS